MHPSLILAALLSAAPLDIMTPVTLSGPNELGTVTVKAGGRLTLADGCYLTCDELRIEKGGRLDVGTPDNPARDIRVTFADTPLDLAADPEQLRHGLLVWGTIEVHGLPKFPHVRTAAAPMAGAKTLTIDKIPTGWQPGDTLYIPDTRQPDYPQSPTTKPMRHEWRTIATIDGPTVTLTAPLTYDHKGQQTAAGDLRFFPVVANLTRSVKFQSANPAGTRAHGYFTEAASVNVRYAHFHAMGRTTNEPLHNTVLDAAGKVTQLGKNQKGRYPVHFHHHHGANNFVGNVVDQPTPLARWGITIHQSHYGKVTDNVVITAGGSGIVTEDGNETANEIRRNYVSHVTGDTRPDARQNEIGFEGPAYWFRGGDNTVTDNLAYGSKDGYVYYARFAPTVYLAPVTPGGMPTKPVDPVTIPIREFARNECTACQCGFSSWWIGARDRTPIPEIGRSIIKDFTCWNVRASVAGYETGNFTYDGLVIVGDKSMQYDSNGGAGFSDYLQWRTVIENATIEGLNSGIRAGSICDALDASGTNPGLFVIRNCRIRCRNNVSVPVPWHNANGRRLPPLTVHMDNVALETLPPAAEHTDVRMGIRAGEFANYPQWVTCWMHTPAWHVQIFGDHQAAGRVLPATSPDGRIVGGPFAMENAKAWYTYGLTSGGELPPANILRSPTIGMLTLTPTAPKFRPLADVILAPGQSWEAAVSAYNPWLNPLDFRITVGPPNLGLENRSGKLNWRAPDEPSAWPVTLTATDTVKPTSPATTATLTFTIIVRKPSS